MPSCPHYRLTPFEYLKVADSWMVVARHLRDDASEFARLHLRFEEAFLLVEGGVAKAGQDLDEEEEDPDQAMDIVAFVLMPPADEVGLMDLFNTQSTRLQFLEKGGSTGRLAPLENRYARISILNLAENRVRKLSVVFFEKALFDDGGEFYYSRITCYFSCFDQAVDCLPTFEKEADSPGEEGKKLGTATVKLGVDLPGQDEQAFASVLELWKV